MLVADNVDAAEMLCEVVLHLGPHDVQVAHAGLAALELAASFEPDVVRVDLGLPDIRGLEVARRLRQRGRNLLLVAITGYGQPANQARSREAGFDHPLTKPVSVERLQQILRATRERHWPRQHLARSAS
jgi:CheY-like chemotaxis protein